MVDTEQVRLWLVPPKDVLPILGEVAPLLEPAVARSKGRYELWDVIALILQGHMQLWVAGADKIEAAAATQILTYPRVRVLNLTFLSGKDMGRWLKFEDDMLKWAKEQGCSQVEACDARGGAWSRVSDWKEKYIMIGKEI